MKKEFIPVQSVEVKEQLGKALDVERLNIFVNLVQPGFN
jgi:ribosomal protein L7Ae-like RNA K-turn-binding protein